jgi:hypothetical protein
MPEVIGFRRALALRFRRLAGLCGFARFWCGAPYSRTAGNIFVRSGEDVVFAERFGMIGQFFP